MQVYVIPILVIVSVVMIVYALMPSSKKEDDRVKRRISGGRAVNRVAAMRKQARESVAKRVVKKVAPIAVNSFVFLAENGWYDNVTFHRVLPGFMAQGGDPSGTGLGGPGYNFINETDPDITFDRAGLLAMANSGLDTNGSQFFITYAPVSYLDGDYTIFGEVIEGMDVVESLSPRDPSESNVLPPGDMILSVEIEER